MNYGFLRHGAVASVEWQAPGSERSFPRFLYLDLWLELDHAGSPSRKLNYTICSHFLVRTSTNLWFVSIHCCQSTRYLSIDGTSQDEERWFQPTGSICINTGEALLTNAISFVSITVVHDSKKKPVFLFSTRNWLKSSIFIQNSKLTFPRPQSSSK